MGHRSVRHIFLNISFALPVLVLLIRGRKIMSQFCAPGTPLQLGPVLDAISNWVAVLFVGITSVFFCFPQGLPVDSSHMNCVSAVIGIFLLVISVYWVLHGKQFEGPKFDVIMGVAAEAREVKQMVAVDASNEKGAKNTQ
jgi:choline transport protein